MAPRRRRPPAPGRAGAGGGVPDFAALRRALEEIRAQMEVAGGVSEEGAPDPLAAAHRDKRDDPLLAAVLAAGDDQPEVLALLSADPVERLLPFVEEIPFVHDGEVSWRVPMAIALLRKRPRDDERFAELLAEAEGFLVEARTRRRQQARQEVIDALARLRKNLAQDDAYLPRPLQALDARFTDWLYVAHSPAALERRGALETLLGELTGARRRWGRGWPLADAEIRAFRSAAVEHARRYLEADWMRTRQLGGYALSNLLAAELAPLWVDPESRRREPVGRLHRLWGEVVSGLYDPRETQRRLRELEAEGLWFHSLAHALLRSAQ